MKLRINSQTLALLLLVIQLAVSLQTRFYSPLSNEVSLHGRHYSDNGEVKYDWPCFKISFCFQNATKVTWHMQDTWNNYEIIIDNKTEKVVQPRKLTNIVVFESSKPQSHCVDIVKITENHYGPLGSKEDSVFKGIQVTNGVLKRQQTTYRYKFEFLGDSLTTSFGDLSGTNPQCMLHMRKNQNCLQSWATLLSNKFNADYRIQAISGKGLVKNNLFMRFGPTMSTKFTQVTDNSKKNTYYYQDEFYPDVFFMYIGANDYAFSIDPPFPNNFIEAYKQMIIVTLRNIIKDSERRPKVISLCDGHNDELCQNIQTAINEAKYGYQYLYYIHLPTGTLGKGDMGCIGHPNAKGHVKIADAVYDQVKSIIQ